MAGPDTSYTGFWWRPGDNRDADSQLGTLVIEADQSMRLEFSVGGFPIMEATPQGQPGAGTLRERPPFDVVFGQCGDDAFTLLNVPASNTRGSPTERPDSQVLSPQRALQGNVTLPSADDALVEGVSVEIDYLLFFSQLTVFEQHEHEVTT